MPNRVRLNLANTHELTELPGVSPEQAERIVRFRAEHGPITSVSELSGILGVGALDAAIAERIDFAPADTTAPESPGA